MNKANIEPTSTTRGSTLSIFKSVSYEATKMKRRLSKVRISNSYPDPGSNRDGLPQRCLRPSRLPIPPSGHRWAVCGCKDKD